MIFFTKNNQFLYIDKNIFVLSFTAFIIGVAKFSWYPVLPVYLVELGATDFQIALSYTLLAIATTFMQFLGGMLSDIIGRKKMIVIPTFLLPVCYLLSAHTSFWIPLIVFLIIANSLSALQLPSFLALIAESAPTTKRGEAYGLLQLFMVLGHTIGPVVGMLLISKINIKNIFFIASLVNLICALGRTVFLEETHNHRSKIRKTFPLKMLLQKQLFKTILALSSLFFVFNLTIKGPFMALYANEISGFDKTQISLFFAIGGFVAVLYSIMGGKIIDKLGSKKVLIYSSLGLGISTLLCSFSTSFTLFVSFATVYVFYQSCQIAHDSFIADITQKQYRGLFIGFFATCNGLVGSLGPYLGGLVAVKFGIQAPLWIAFFFSLVFILFFSNISVEKI